MMKRMASMAGVMALALSTMVGCSDTPVDATGESSVGADDAYTYLKQDQSVLTDLSELPTSGDVLGSIEFSMNPPGRDSLGRDPRDTTRKPPVPPAPPRDTVRKPPVPPRDSSNRPPVPPRDTAKKPPMPPRDSTTRPPVPPRDTVKRSPLPPRKDKDYGRLIPGSYGNVIRQLRLSASQDSAVRICFTDYRDCSVGGAQRYAAARRTLAESMESSMRRIRAAVDGGTMTRDEARTAIESVQSSYRAGVQELSSAYKTALDDCRTTFENCVKAQLNADQLAIWNRLVHR